MLKSFASLAFIAAAFGGCMSIPPPPNGSGIDPSNPSAPEASARRSRPNLVATTQIYLDPAVGRGAQKMDMSKMQGMGGMQSMDHSKMQGMENKQPAGASPAPTAGMQGMDHSKMPGMSAKPSPAGSAAEQPAGMQGMDHSGMKGMESPAAGAAASPPDKEALETEMKKTSDEMKKLSDELKAKSDAVKPADKSQRQPSRSPQPDHGQMQHQGMSPAPPDQPQGNVTYTCVMHPEVKSDKPGKCPKCGMKLVPKSAAQ